MHRRRAAVVGRVARLVLLACTLLGLAAMHTIGHSAVGHGAGHYDEVGDPPTSAAEVLGAMAQAAGGTPDLLAALDGCAGDGCAHAALMPSGDGGMGGWELCVAVLSAFAVAVLLVALLLAAVTGRFAPPAGRRRGIAAPRGPPVRQFGLTLATVSVLRI
jgi:hypothetical protein